MAYEHEEEVLPVNNQPLLNARLGAKTSPFSLEKQDGNEDITAPKQ
jgi:hypothetical protein